MEGGLSHGLFLRLVLDALCWSMAGSQRPIQHALAI